MGNIISSFFSGFGKVFSDLFGSPLDFFEGKSCSSVCQSTWDFICFIENFCVANLLKMATVLVLIYIVLLFFYLLQKLGICECICQSLFRIVWACVASWFHAWEYCCIFLCVKLRKLKRVRRKNRRDIEEEFDAGDDEYDTSEAEYDDESFSNHVPRRMEKSRSVSHKWKDYRGARLRKSMRPRNHRIRVDISRASIHSGRRNHIKHRNHGSTVHDIRVTRTSRFAHKGRNYRGGVVKHRRR